MNAVLRWLREYDSFDCGEENKPMRLDEAVRKAAELSRSDQKHFYRVRPVDSAFSGFRIEKVSKADEWKRYAERLQRATRRYDHVPYSYTFR